MENLPAALEAQSERADSVIDGGLLPGLSGTGASIARVIIIGIGIPSHNIGNKRSRVR